MESYCRLCAKTKHPNHLLYNLRYIRDKLVECCQWPEQQSPNETKLPQNVCDLCCLQLEQYIHFKKAVSDAQNELEHLISQSDDECAVPVVDVVAEGVRVIKEEPSLEVIEWNTIESEVDCINTDEPQSNDDVSDLNMHSTNNSSTKFQCCLCKSEWKGRHSLERHIRINHTVGRHEASGSQSQHFSCDICGNVFLSKSGSSKHLESHESSDTSNICEPIVPNATASSTDSNIDPANEPLYINGMHKCPHCQTSYKYRRSVVRHIHRKQCKERPFECAHCSKAFATKYNLTKHQQLHGRPFKCPECPKSFTIHEDLTKHLKLHGEEQPVDCPKCSQTFKNQANASRHMLRIYATERPFKCEHCLKTFAVIYDLTSHKTFTLCRLYEEKI